MGTPAPWADRLLQVGKQGFALPFWREVPDTPRQNKSDRSADALGLIRRYQRSTCVTTALPVPMRGREIHFAADDLRPMNVAAMFARPTPAMIHATLSCPFNATTTELASIANMMKNANHCPTATVL